MDRTVNHEDVRYKDHGKTIGTVHHEDSTRIRKHETTTDDSEERRRTRHQADCNGLANTTARRERWFNRRTKKTGKAGGRRWVGPDIVR